MKSVEEINYLLQFLTESEKDNFNKIYSEGIEKIKNKQWTINLIKNTILKKNKQVKNQEEIIEIKTREYNEEILRLSNKVKELEEIIKELKEIIISNKYSKNEIEMDDYLFLQALRHAGVDNWEGYDNALDIYEEMLINE